KAMQKVIPKRPPGLTADDIYDAVLPSIASIAVPWRRGGRLVVQVRPDWTLEANGLIAGDPRIRPLRLTRRLREVEARQKRLPYPFGGARLQKHARHRQK